MTQQTKPVPNGSKTFRENVVKVVRLKATAHTMDRWKLAAEGIALVRGEDAALELAMSAPTVNILVFTAWRDLLNNFGSSSNIPETYADIFKEGTKLRIKVILAKKPEFALVYEMTLATMKRAVATFGVETALEILKASNNFKELRATISTIETTLRNPILAGAIYATSEKELRSAIGKAVDAKTGFSDANEAVKILMSALRNRTSEGIRVRIMEIFETSFDSRELNERINDLLTGGSGKRTEDMVGRAGLTVLDNVTPDRVVVPAPSNESATVVLETPISLPDTAPVAAVESPVITTAIITTPQVEIIVEKPALRFDEIINALSNPKDKEKIAEALKILEGTVAMEMLKEDSPQTAKILDLVYRKGLSVKNALAKVKGNKPSLKTATKNIETALKALQRFTFMDALTLDLRIAKNKEITREAVIKAKEDRLMQRLSKRNHRAYSVLKFRYLDSKTVASYEVVAEKLRTLEKSKKALSREAIRLLEKAGLEELCMFAGDKYA